MFTPLHKSGGGLHRAPRPFPVYAHRALKTPIYLYYDINSGFSPLHQHHRCGIHFVSGGGWGRRPGARPINRISLYGDEARHQINLVQTGRRQQSFQVPPTVPTGSAKATSLLAGDRYGLDPRRDNQPDRSKQGDCARDGRCPLDIHEKCGKHTQVPLIEAITSTSTYYSPPADTEFEWRHVSNVAVGGPLNHHKCLYCRD